MRIQILDSGYPTAVLAVKCIIHNFLQRKQIYASIRWTDWLIAVVRLTIN